MIISATRASSESPDNSVIVPCTRCGDKLPADVLAAGPEGTCPSCRGHQFVQVFPALFHTPPPYDPMASALLENEASCYNHATKRADYACGQCGRFLCALCDVELDGRHWCPTCLNAGLRERKIEALETQRTLYDSIALGVATIPLFFFYIVILTAPLAIFLSVRYWKAPSSLVPRSKVRQVVAILISLLQLLAIAGLIIALVVGLGKARR